MTNKKATKEAKRVAEEAQKKEKDLVEKSTEVITNTWSLFYHITNDPDGHTRDEFPLFGTTSQIYNFSIPLKEIPNIIK